MINSDFKVLNGGLSETSLDSRKEFISSYVTDTRLMGMNALYIHWRLVDNTKLTHFHQFFLLNTEDGIFDSYEGIVSEIGEWNYERPEKATPIELVRNRFAGGLGGEEVPLGEMEAVALIQEYIENTKHIGEELPDKYDEYSFLLRKKIRLTDEQSNRLFSLQCKNVETDYEVVNYFLMRTFGKDYKAAKYLSTGYVRTNIFDEIGQATLYKNSIEEKDGVYLSESLLETDDSHYIATSEIELEDLRVKSFKRINLFKISPLEVAMILARPEYVKAVDLDIPGDLFQPGITKLSKHAIITEYESGRLFMLFKKNNDHVKDKTFMLRNDVLGLYYVLKSGQVILCAATEVEINILENDLKSGLLKNSISSEEDFYFEDPIFYDFITSGYMDFLEFIENFTCDDN